ncbi:MAG: hypothetical protein B6D46_00080 [Polyangiaceae bacterium UTPRO1]|nr:MAG: hypothetical protein B6D46_00080 [Polyangiaceae bacterium UTPRO1]
MHRAALDHARRMRIVAGEAGDLAVLVERQPGGHLRRLLRELAAEVRPGAGVLGFAVATKAVLRRRIDEGIIGGVLSRLRHPRMAIDANAPAPRHLLVRIVLVLVLLRRMRSDRSE